MSGCGGLSFNRETGGFGISVHTHHNCHEKWMGDSRDESEGPLFGETDPSGWQDPSIFQNLNSSQETVWGGYKKRFSDLGSSFTESPVLMTSATAAAITAALIWNPVGWFLAGVSVGLIIAGAYNAYTNKSASQFGVTLADATLLGAGFAIGAAAKAAKIVNSVRAGAALHLADDIAATILVARTFFQD